MKTHSRIIKREPATPTSRAHTYLELDAGGNNLSTLVARHISEEPDQEFQYLLLSEPDTRTLRVEFFGEDRARQLIQISFRHNDIPGALDTITRAVAESNFNILVSILRKQTAEKNDWEAVLEYTGEALSAEPDDPREFVRGKHGDAIGKARNELAVYDIELLVPPHTVRSRSIAAKFAGPIRLDPQRVAKPALTPPELLRPEVSMEQRLARDRVLIDAERIVEPAKRKTVFISCPKEANDLSDLLEAELRDTGWVVTYYRGNTGAPIAHREVRERIFACDRFIGIWHPAHGEEHKAEPHTSPWMHYELGVAMAFRKQCKIVAQERVLLEARRVHADPEVIRYKETDDFRREAIKVLLRFVENTESAD